MPSRSNSRRFPARKALLLSGLVLILPACSQSQTTLPDAAAMPTRASADAERARHAKAMGETATAGTARQTKALEQIQGTR